MAESDLIRGNVDTIILKVLYEGDRYGYDLIKQINERSDGQWEIKQPTVYACLKRLEKRGFVSSYWDSSESDGGRRKYYSLTESGKEVFIQYKNEFERANALFGGLISDSDPIYIQPDDDFSDVEDDSYSVPKRRPSRAKRAQKPKQDAAEVPQTNAATEQAEQIENADTPVQEQPTVEPQYVQPDLFSVNYVQDYPAAQYAEESEQPAEQEQAEQPPARQAVDPQSIIERIFAAEQGSGNSYSDVHGRYAYEDKQKTEARETTTAKPQTQQQPQPQSNALAVQQRTEPAVIPERSKQVAEVTEQPRRTATEQPRLDPVMPMTGFPEDESPARREYKTVLSELVDRYEMAQPDIRVTTETPVTEQAAVDTQAADGRFYKIKQAARDLGDDITIRNHNDSAKQYNHKYYYYSNKLLMTHYTVMCAAMFLIGLILFLTCYVGLGLRMKYDYLLYIAAGLLPILMFLFAVICYATDIDKKKRINVNFRAAFIIRCVIMVQVAVVIYCLNLIWGMPVSFSYAYLPSLLIPLAYSLFIPISEAIFRTLLTSENYAVE